MVASVLTFGGILAFVAFVISLFLVRASKEKNIGYYPGILIAAIGLLCMFASPLVNTQVMGAPLGGVGIACMFAAAVTLILISIIDAYQQPNTKNA
ncbi:hypothetical protein [Oceanobacillus sp. Castelsardo]|uniref:hypothetical protein n=1 Tax=Oceanobacillus sp. Castelsardo TaxID=1851204 RepID=UPI000838F61F|nr:hypothetical protein [Oceanobacillus sp. Castelsardo]